MFRIVRGVALSLLAVSLCSSSAYADKASAPVVVAATQSADGTTLFVEGAGFGASPSVALGGIVLGGVTVNSIGTSLTAVMPALAAGSYQLVVTPGGKGKETSPAFEMTLGVNGPAGP